MKYIPSEEAEEINFKTDKHPWRNVLLLVGASITIYFVFLITLGLLGETLAVKIPPRYERQLFSSLNFEIQQKAWGLGDQIVADIFKKNSLNDDFKPEIFLSCESTVNAITLPGKKIIVFKGLLDEIKSMNSLYFIIGHEIGHILNRDHLKSMGRALAISLGLFFINVGGDANSFFSLNQALIDRQFSQRQEESSDQKAIDFTIKRFNGLYSSHEFFDHIQTKEPDTLKLIRFLNTHPMTEERIDKIKNHNSYNAKTTTVESFDSKQIKCP